MSRILMLCAALCAAACARSTLYPARPAASPGPARAEPSPSRLVIHATVARAALETLLDRVVPSTGQGTVPLLGGERTYQWTRPKIALALVQGRLEISAHVDVHLGLVVDHAIGIDLRVLAEPVVSADYGARLQSLTVEVTSSDRRMKLAQTLGGALDLIRDQILSALRDFRYDLAPILRASLDRVARPIALNVGAAAGCARLDLFGIEAGPTVLADGIEKDFAFLVAPSVTFPCAPAPASAALPPLQNVAALPSGPFVVELPVAARYQELERAMTLAFAGGKLFFSKDLPQLYLEKPEVYPSGDSLVVKLHLAGRVDRAGIHTTLDGDLFMRGHPEVVDNELRVPDLQPTIDTSSFLLKLAAAIDGDAIRDQARAALRLDLGARIAEARDRLALSMPLELIASPPLSACLNAEARRVEVTGVFGHGDYLRLYVRLTARAAFSLPCPTATSALP